MCLNWKRETKWMKINGVNVEDEFASKVKQVDELMELLGQNNRLEYIQILNQLMKNKKHS